MDSTLSRIQNWYKLNCNGDWEHSYGYSIANLDNPGWSIRIDLQDTALENLEYVKDYQSDSCVFDWFNIKTIDNTLNILCGPDYLEKTLKIFLDEIIPNFCNPEFTYDIYLPLDGYKFDIWTLARGKVINEKTIQLTEIFPVEYKNIKVKDLDMIDFKQTDLERLSLKYKIGENIEVKLAEVFDGLILTTNK